jgi:putative transposase
VFRFIGLCFGTVVRLLRARRGLLLENLALRQQLAALKRRNPRPRLDLLDKLFWVAIRRFWSAWQQSLIAVTPETVVRWYRGGFRLYWKLISKVRRPVGRRQTSKEVRELIFRMVVENPTWGAPGIHGELLMLSFEVSERTISRWMKRAPRDPEPAKHGLTFLRNHREAIAAMDFFTVPTITFSALYCLPLLQILMVLIVVGVLLWLVNRFIPMQGTIKSILNAVVIIGVVLWLLNIFGLFQSLSRIHVGR